MEGKQLILLLRKIYQWAKERSVPFCCHAFNTNDNFSALDSFCGTNIGETQKWAITNVRQFCRLCWAIDDCCELDDGHYLLMLRSWSHCSRWFVTVTTRRRQRHQQLSLQNSPLQAPFLSNLFNYQTTKSISLLSLQQLCRLFRPSLLIGQQLHRCEKYANICVLPLLDLCIVIAHHYNCSHSFYQSTHIKDNQTGINSVINLNSPPFVLNTCIYVDIKLIQIYITEVHSPGNQSGVERSGYLHFLPPNQQLPSRTTSGPASNLCCTVASNVSAQFFFDFLQRVSNDPKVLFSNTTRLDRERKSCQEQSSQTLLTLRGRI